MNYNILGSDEAMLAVPASIDALMKSYVGHYYNLAGAIIILLIVYMIYTMYYKSEHYGNANLSAMTAGRYAFDSPSAAFDNANAQVAPGSCNSAGIDLNDQNKYYSSEVKKADDAKEQFSEKSLHNTLFNN